jgi:hypothetical protein
MVFSLHRLRSRRVPCGTASATFNERFLASPCVAVQMKWNVVILIPNALRPNSLTDGQ